MKHFFIILSLVISYSLKAQFDGAAEWGMGGVNTSSLVGINAFKNPVAISPLATKWGVSIQADNRFLVKDFSVYSLSVVKKIKNQFLFGGVASSGNQYFNETSGILGYNLPLNPKLKAGIALQYIHQNLMASSLKYQSLNAHVGLSYQIISALRIAAGYQHVGQTQSEVRLQKEEYYSFGVAYTMNKLELYGEVNKNISHPLTLKFGLNYIVNEKLQLRYGLNTLPFTTSLGVGVKLQDVWIDISFGYMNQLGFSPATSISYFSPEQQSIEE